MSTSNVTYEMGVSCYMSHINRLWVLYVYAQMNYLYWMMDQPSIQMPNFSQAIAVTTTAKIIIPFAI